MKKLATVAALAATVLTLTVTSDAVAAHRPDVPTPVGAAPTGAAPVAAVVLTNRDSGRTVDVAPGDVIEVRLTGALGENDTWAWSTPRSSSATVLAQSVGTTSPDGDAEALFQATGPGTGRITAIRRCVPGPGAICPFLAVLWVVDVDVRQGADVHSGADGR
ncbi:hypothetical protein [Streptacidiphilus fuscans]|uniref:Proteinase inhibitor I42 chagasin domain-containing protein n=1 Tax=Streptacidiphilus fuscans TaxID=2789292 RepID=A0A931BEF5_9ACTN|nr:hypothetical protein [Streptacidiphilus fuscans]MBF9071940.1 hypothetical protein [Streptacidiphilus fuscans]